MSSFLFYTMTPIKETEKSPRIWPVLYEFRSDLISYKNGLTDFDRRI